MKDAQLKNNLKSKDKNRLKLNRKSLVTSNKKKNPEN
jgi:hypothetical protein